MTAADAIASFGLVGVAGLASASAAPIVPNSCGIFSGSPVPAGYNDIGPTSSCGGTSAKEFIVGTSGFGVSGNVLNLPLRQPPAVLARAAAGLDLLSDGRVSLGIGAGYYWDDIQAIGGQRLTPLQAVAALDEAIDVIRGVWDADVPGTLNVDGGFYPVHAAQRGPAPGHEIPIWLGAHKLKMLDLLGRKADGWLASLPVMEPGGLPKGNAIIDNAARAAGRDPREVTRLLNIIPDQQTPEALAQMTLEDGVSIFIVISDEPDVLERFAAETIPAVRGHVARSRGRHSELLNPKLSTTK
jgi:alkanesulfonate monooxygenase SsuD/methylene tetrahydromethanopterin reductase-like flavin-dependent oxidoreductase (luciferase family)